MFRLFVGDNSDRVIEIFRAQEKGEIGIFLNWAVILFGSVWFFYRKMPFMGGLYFVIPILVFIIFPRNSVIFFLLYNPMVAGVADALFVWKARRCINRSEVMFSDQEQREAWIERKGGYSMLGLLLGVGVEGGMLLLAT